MAVSELCMLSCSAEEPAGLVQATKQQQEATEEAHYARPSQGFPCGCHFKWDNLGTAAFLWVQVFSLCSLLGVVNEFTFAVMSTTARKSHSARTNYSSHVQSRPAPSCKAAFFGQEPAHRQRGTRNALRAQAVKRGILIPSSDEHQRG